MRHNSLSAFTARDRMKEAQKAATEPTSDELAPIYTAIREASGRGYGEVIVTIPVTRDVQISAHLVNQGYTTRPGFRDDWCEAHETTMIISWVEERRSIWPLSAPEGI